ncbi:hypothetical protein EJB05_06049 [Eragrostis curvula]|uniref:Uncharacterized protein n=1 Tax=Eragrostis curvula TaxID=38414 RepID=A0A5J9WE81_9POAL|nr:hypothetical protein EJB05_06049 [Eragrostis curvula]
MLPAGNAATQKIRLGTILLSNTVICNLRRKHPVELRKQISCSLKLMNKTDEQVAQNLPPKNVPGKELDDPVKMTSPKKYRVRVPPRSTADFLGNVLQCKRTWMRHRTCNARTNSLCRTPLWAMKSPKDITGDMTTKEPEESEKMTTEGLAGRRIVHSWGWVFTSQCSTSFARWTARYSEEALVILNVQSFLQMGAELQQVMQIRWIYTCCYFP